METAQALKLWTERMTIFAGLVGREVEAITKCLAGVIGEPGDAAVQLLMDKVASPDADLKQALAGLNIPSALLNKGIAFLRSPITEPGTTAVTVPGQTGLLGTIMSILPAVPDDKSFIENLKVGGDLRVGATEVVSAVKVALASNLDIFTLPKRILEAMDDFAVAQGLPNNDRYYKLGTQIARRRYADILSAIGAEGFQVNTVRKAAFINAVNGQLWAALHAYTNRLTAWNRNWRDSMPETMLLTNILMQQGGANELTNSMMTPPDTTPLKAAAEGFVNTLNRIFAGSGVPVARALAYDATWIADLVTDPTLPALVGATSKEQMLQSLGVNVGVDIILVEKQLAAYTLAILQLPKVKADVELRYLIAMAQLGAAIPWDFVLSGAGAERLIADVEPEIEE